MTHRISQAAFEAMLLASVLAYGGCGNVTAGGVGEAEVYMTGDSDAPPATAPEPSRVVGPADVATAPSPAVVILAGLEGDLDVTAALFLRSDGGDLVPLTAAGPVSSTLDLAGSLEPRVAVASVPAGTYEALEVRFTDVTADVTGGLEVDGLPFVGPVEVDIGGTSLEVTKPIALVIDDGESVEILVDLNADLWVPLLDIVTRLVAAGDFAAAVTVGVR
jgi:hypothetical protein